MEPTELKYEREEKLAEYLKMRQAYREKRAGLSETIRRAQEELNKLRPRTKHGTLICKTCDCTSMKLVGRTSAGCWGRQTEVYQCEICEEYYTDI